MFRYKIATVCQNKFLCRSSYFQKVQQELESELGFSFIHLVVLNQCLVLVLENLQEQDQDVNKKKTRQKARLSADLGQEQEY